MMAQKIDRHHFNTIYSTNTWALQNAATFDREAITIVTTDGQSAGRGRLNRVWESPTGVNLYMTFGIFVEEGEIYISNIPQILALAAADLIHELGVEAQLKWPNDIVIRGKKVGGILCETKPIEDHRFVAVGIGLNINMSDETIREIVPNATSLLIETGQKQHCDSIKILLEEHFIESLAIFMEEGFDKFFEAFQAKIYKPKTFHFHHQDQITKGQFESLNPDGSLTLLLNNGEKKTYHYGEIV
ncbi:MAG: biotin--[acetyl-CoA-carboxylase] ligase [Chlamydiota bacterium]